jgi:hypothetical protein
MALFADKVLNLSFSISSILSAGIVKVAMVLVLTPSEIVTRVFEAAYALTKEELYTVFAVVTDISKFKGFKILDMY